MDCEFFKDKVAVITGAGGLLCSEVSIDMAKKGARVVLLEWAPEKLDPIVDKIKALGTQYMVVRCDVTNEESMEKAADDVLKTFGPCNFLINGAGGNNNKAVTTNFHYEPEEITDQKPDNMTGFFDLDMKVFESVLKINTIGTVIPSRVFARQMAANGGGSILNFASMNSYRPLTRVPAYAMSKAGVINFTQWLATYLAPAGIRVNGVAPGFFINDRSKLILGTPEEGLTQRGLNVMSHTPMQRFGKAQDLLGCIEWLLNDEMSAYVTGVTVPVDGGFLSHPGI